MNDRALAHAILRLTLGVNIALHGAQRLPHAAAFTAATAKAFDGVLPGALVVPYASALPWIEAIVGVLLVLGLWERWTLVGGALFMTSLTFGTALRAEHTVLAEQLVYELVYFVLLATRDQSRYGLDGLIRRR